MNEKTLFGDNDSDNSGIIRKTGELNDDNNDDKIIINNNKMRQNKQNDVGKTVLTGTLNVSNEMSSVVEESEKVPDERIILGVESVNNIENEASEKITEQEAVESSYDATEVDDETKVKNDEGKWFHIQFSACFDHLIFFRT